MTDVGPEPGATPLFVDTGPFYARFVETASRRDRAETVTTIVHPTETDFYGVSAQFAQYENPDISFTDHMILSAIIP